MQSNDADDALNRNSLMHLKFRLSLDYAEKQVIAEERWRLNK